MAARLGLDGLIVRVLCEQGPLVYRVEIRPVRHVFIALWAVGRRGSVVSRSRTVVRGGGDGLFAGVDEKQMGELREDKAGYLLVVDPAHAGGDGG